MIAERRPDTQLGEQQPDAGLSAGARLRRQRETKKLSVAEVAAKLYLQASVIEALEAGDYAQLPPATYTRGYLKNYAKLLNTPPESILMAYAAEQAQQAAAQETAMQEAAAQEEPAPQNAEPGVPPEEPPSQGNAAGLSWSGLWYFGAYIVVLALFVWWLQSVLPDFGLWSPKSGPGRGDRGMTYRAQGLPYPITIVEHPDTPFYRAPFTGSFTESGELVEALPLAYDESIIVSGSGPDLIRMVISSDSWIEVFDADDEKIFYDLARDGQTLELSGKAPFSVLLGYAQGVSIELNGAPVETVQSPSGINIRRFTLPSGRAR